MTTKVVLMEPLMTTQLASCQFLNTESCYGANFVVTNGTGCCDNDNIRCRHAMIFRLLFQCSRLQGISLPGRRAWQLPLLREDPRRSVKPQYIEGETKCPRFCRRQFWIHFLVWNLQYWIHMSLKFVPVNNKPASGQTMAWRYYLNQCWSILMTLMGVICHSELTHGVWSNLVDHFEKWPPKM